MLIVFLVFALVAIRPQIFGNDGVTIKNVLGNSTAANAGIENPSSKITPVAKEKIISINGNKVSDLGDYYVEVNKLLPNSTARIETDKGIYTIQTPSNLDLGLTVYDAPSSNLRKGLDLAGGTRVLLQPEKRISSEDLELTIENLKERLNVYGLSDVIVRSASDLAGEDFILIEMLNYVKNLGFHCVIFFYIFIYFYLFLFMNCYNTKKIYRLNFIFFFLI